MIVADPLTVACPICGAKPGEQCQMTVTVGLHRPRVTPHITRIDKATRG